MCLLCVQWEKEKMSNQEAIDAIGEILITEEDAEKRDHLFNLINRVMDKEDEIRDNQLETISFDDIDEDDECQ
jgi:hypothetical protein